MKFGPSLFLLYLAKMSGKRMEYYLNGNLVSVFPFLGFVVRVLGGVGGGQ